MSSVTVILPAAGRSLRFGRGENKLLEPLGKTTVIAHTVDAFARRGDVDSVVIATSTDPSVRQSLAEFETRRSGRAPVIYCLGGESRAQSVRRALDCVSDRVEWVAVHDAARPLVSQQLIDRCFEAALQHGAAAPALAVAQTVKQANGPLPARVERTVPRAPLWAMQTPQVMRRRALLEAFEACPLPLEQVTDDLQLLELAGQEAWLVAGEERNLKITSSADLRIAELFLSE